MSREEFLEWVDRQPSWRFERIDGIVIAMAPERSAHNRRKTAAHAALRRATRAAGLTSCEAFTEGMTVPVENSDFIPDAILRCGPRLPGEATGVPDPLVLVEVLSPERDARPCDKAPRLFQAADGSALSDRLA